MGRWTEWIKIAKYDDNYLDDLCHDGPACYELGVRQWLIQSVKPAYVGETKNEKKRVAAYAQHGSHLGEIIQEHLGSGHALYYRAQAKKSKREAKKMQDSLLMKFDYDWNVLLNGNKEV